MTKPIITKVVGLDDFYGSFIIVFCHFSQQTETSGSGAREAPQESRQQRSRDPRRQDELRFRSSLPGRDCAWRVGRPPLSNARIHTPSTPPTSSATISLCPSQSLILEDNLNELK